MKRPRTPRGTCCYSNSPCSNVSIRPNSPTLPPETVHVMVEAKKLAFADREAYLADPDFVDVPIEGLLSPEYAAARSRLIDPESCAQGVKEGDPWAYMDRPPDESKRYHRPGMTPVGAGMPSESDTTHFCVVDRWGNAVGELQSVQTGFGSGVIAGDTGILLNNRMTYWNLGAGHANLLHPGQRVRHTMNPVMVFSEPVEDHGELELVCGTPGADTQVQTNFQVVSLCSTTASTSLKQSTHRAGRTTRAL